MRLNTRRLSNQSSSRPITSDLIHEEVDFVFVSAMKTFHTGFVTSLLPENQTLKTISERLASL